ncbi:MAG: septum site-determining protein MinC, partial [Eubacteriales bacterium]
SFYKGTLKNGQVLEMENSIIVIGDVESGCKIISEKNIIILGTLHGEAHAGATGEEGHFVIALDMEPTKLKIGDCTYKAEDKKSKWVRKQKKEPKIAYMEDYQIYMKTLTKELLKEIPI